MKSRKCRMLAATMSLALAYSASAAVTVSFSGDENLDSFLIPGSEQAIGEARYGNGALNGDWELGAGEDTQTIGMFTQGQFAWVNGGSESFELAWDGSDLSLEVGGTLVSYAAPAITATDVLIRAASGVGNQAMLSDLELNGSPVGAGLTSADGTNVAEYLGILDMFANPFSLTGSIAFSWTDADSLAGSRPSVQFKIGEVVPEPASLSLLGLGALLALRRR